MSRPPAERITNVEAPATLVAGERARQLAAQGRDIIDLGQSSPYYPTPPHIVEAGVRALYDGFTNISSSRGLPELRNAIYNKLGAYNRLAVNPNQDILITPGSKKGLYDAINSYIGPGDEVLLVEPTWVSYRQQVELAQGVPISVPLSEEEEYSLTYQRLKEYITPRSKMIVINNPNNPTGRVYSTDELADLALLAEEHDLLVLCDETYEYFLYDGKSHITFATLPGMWERTLTSYTFTKSYSMSGWRLGCIVASGDLLDPLLKIHEHTSSFVAPFIQMAGVEALTGTQVHLDVWQKDCDILRREVVKILNQTDRMYCPLPEGATFVFPRVSSQYSSVELATLLVEEEGVVVTPGSGFGDCGESHFRIALMRSPADRVETAAKKISDFIGKL